MLSNTFLWSGSKVSLGWLQSHGVLHDPFSGPIHFNILVQILKRHRIKMKTSLPIFCWAYVLQIGKVFRILYFSRPWIFPVVSTWHLWTKSLTLAAEQPTHFKPASKVREMSKRVVALCTLVLLANLNLGGLLVKPQCEWELACRLNKCLICYMSFLVFSILWLHFKSFNKNTTLATPSSML